MFSGSNNLSQYNSRNVVIWIALAFQAGAVNSGGFLACHRFVTHTTGFATHFGAEFAQGNYASAFGMATVPLFFLVGCMFAAFFVDHKLALKKAPRYDFLMSAIGLIMILVSACGATGVFGVFGDTYETSVDFALLALLSTAMGIQNAAITSASGAVIRTTHLTGITTDLGIGLVRIFSSGIAHSVREQERKATGMRVGLILSFIIGSAVSAFVFIQYKYLGFLIPGVTAFGVLFYARQTSAAVHRQGARA